SGIAHCSFARLPRSGPTSRYSTTWTSYVGTAPRPASPNSGRDWMQPLVMAGVLGRKTLNRVHRADSKPPANWWCRGCISAWTTCLRHPQKVDFAGLRLPGGVLFGRVSQSLTQGFRDTLVTICRDLASERCCPIGLSPALRT